MNPTRIQLSRKKGFKLPPNTVNCARPGRWGNPFKVQKETGHYTDYLYAVNGACFSQEAAVDRFRRMLKAGVTPPFALANIRDELRGKNLACWCKPGTPCHADVLLEVANR